MKIFALPTYIKIFFIIIDLSALFCEGDDNAVDLYLYIWLPFTKDIWQPIYLTHHNNNIMYYYYDYHMEICINNFSP